MNMIQSTSENRRLHEPSHSSDWPGVVVELRPSPEAREVFLRLCHLPHCVFFDSARADPQLARYSFIAADPFMLLAGSADDRCVWKNLESLLQRFAAPTIPNLPPFQGGLAGFFSYELARSLERLPRPLIDEFLLPGLLAGVYDVVVALDHQTQQGWIISQGFPERDPMLRHRRAKSRAADFLRLLNSPQKASEFAVTSPLPARRVGPQFPVGKIAGLTSNFSHDGYLAMVHRGIEYIFAGDVFQVNLAQRLLYPADGDSVSLYLRLRERNPAPFAAYFDLGDFQIVSSSPERFLQVRGRSVETRPIKGTRRRADAPKSDRLAARQLLASQKDHAENVMIVDLLRNDLSRVCTPESVIVRELCRLERYEFVQHLVSVVQGTLKEQCGPLDLLRAAFPGGSVTGAPKIRAMEIITELEQTARGAYCGAMAYLGFDGALDSSILIRTITAGRGSWQFPIGGGIVAQSDPEREYQETWDKAEGLLRSLQL